MTIERPDIFTPAEIERMRGDIDAHRSPGAYEPGKWSVSPLNRDPTVTGEYPTTVRLRDISLRAIELLPGVSSDVAAKRSFLRKIVRAGLREVVTQGPGPTRGVRELSLDAEAVKDENAGCDLVAPFVRSCEDLQALAEAGYSAVQVFIPPWNGAAVLYEPVHLLAWRGEDWRDAGIPGSRAEFVERAKRLLSAAQELGLRVQVPLLMISYATDEIVLELCREVAAAGASEIALFDGPGGVGPEAFGHLVRLAKAAAPDVSIGLHPHNMFGLGVACATEAVKAGADVVEVSVNGYCGGCGNADLAASSAAFEVLYGVDTGVRLEQLTALAREGEAMTGHKVAWNHPLTGSDVFRWGGMDFMTQEVPIDPLLHNSVDPGLVGGERAAPLTLESGPFTLLDRLDAIGVDVDRDQVEDLLGRCKAAIRARGRLLTDGELSEIAQTRT